MSAWLVALMKLGLASMKCGSSWPLPKTVTDTWSPPISRARLPRSGTVAHTFNGSSARAATALRQSTTKANDAADVRTTARDVRVNMALILSNSILVGGMRADEVLEADPEREHLVVLQVVQVVVVDLEADARELGREPFQEGRYAVAVVPERVVVPAADAGATAAGVLKAQAAAPARHEPVDA